MKHRTLLAAAVLVAATPLVAQELVEGTWTGTVAPPDAPAMGCTYVVSKEGDTLAITIEVPGRGSFPFENVRLEEGDLLFEWSEGTTDLSCRLKPQEDDSYKGECVDSGGTPGTLHMVPPG